MVQGSMRVGLMKVAHHVLQDVALSRMQCNLELDARQCTSQYMVDKTDFPNIENRVTIDVARTSDVLMRSASRVMWQLS